MSENAKCPKICRNLDIRQNTCPSKYTWNLKRAQIRVQSLKTLQKGAKRRHWQNARNLLKRAQFSQMRRTIRFDRWQRNHKWKKKTQQRAQFCANWRNLAQPSAVPKSVQFCFSQPPPPTLHCVPFFETRANLVNEQKLSTCTHFQTHNRYVSLVSSGCFYGSRENAE